MPNYSLGPNYSIDPNEQAPDDPFADWEALKKLGMLPSHATPSPDALGVSREPPPASPLPMAPAHQGGAQNQGSPTDYDSVDPAAVLRALKPGGPLPPSDNVGVDDSVKPRMLSPDEVAERNRLAREQHEYNMANRRGGRFMPEQEAGSPHQAARLAGSLATGSEPRVRADGSTSGEQDVVNFSGDGSVITLPDVRSRSGVSREEYTDERIPDTIKNPGDAAREAAEKDAAIMRAYRGAMPGLASLDAMNAAAMGADPNAMLAGYRPIFEPLETELAKKRGEAAKLGAEGQYEAMKHDRNGPLAIGSREALLADPMLDNLVKRTAEQTGKDPEEVKNAFRQRYIKSMNPAEIKYFTENLKAMGEVTTQKLDQAKSDAERRYRETETAKIAQELRQTRSQWEALEDKNSATTRGFKEWVLRMDPDAANMPGFWDMTGNDLLRSSAPMNKMFEVFKDMNLNRAKVNAEAFVSDEYEAKKTTGGGQGIWGQTATVPATQADVDEVSRARNNHKVLWDSSDTIYRKIASAGGAKQAAQIKANSPQGAALLSDLRNFAKTYQALNPQGGDIANEMAKALADGNIAALIWGEEGKGGLVSQAIWETQQRTARFNDKFINKQIAMGDGPEYPPMGYEFEETPTNLGVGYRFFLPDRNIIYVKSGGKWQRKEERREAPPQSNPASLPRTGK